jgi:cytoskeletal protein RodZ
MEDHAMSLIRNGYAVSTRRGFWGALFSALLALALFYPGAATAQEVKQIKLTEKQIQGFIAASKDMAKLYEGADPNKPDPKVEAQAETVAKKNGFANLAEYDDVSTNISIIMSGIDPQTKKFAEPPEQIKQEIAALKADKSVPEAEKKTGLAQLEAALKTAKPIQFKENIALVLKYFDKLSPLMQG